VVGITAGSREVPGRNACERRHTYRIIILIIIITIIIIIITPTHSLTPHSTVLLEKLTRSQPVKIFPTFYGT